MDKMVQEKGKDILFFVDNIFRFTQAGSELSALLGRMPSAVGYQPTGNRNGFDAGKNYINQKWFNHFCTGGVRTSG